MEGERFDLDGKISPEDIGWAKDFSKKTEDAFMGQESEQREISEMFKTTEDEDSKELSEHESEIDIDGLVEKIAIDYKKADPLLQESMISAIEGSLNTPQEVLIKSGYNLLRVEAYKKFYEMYKKGEI